MKYLVAAVVTCLGILAVVLITLASRHEPDVALRSSDSSPSSEVWPVSLECVVYKLTFTRDPDKRFESCFARCQESWDARTAFAVPASCEFVGKKYYPSSK
jgi:hypothetical protein